MVIRIPEGVRLPLVATIQSSGNFETHMSGRLFWAGSAPERRFSSSDTGEQPRSRAATIQETSEPADPTPKRPLSLRSARTGVLHVSEASVPAPQSSGISAQGEVFFPDHTRESGHGEPANRTPARVKDQETASSQTPTTDDDTSVENHPGSGQPTDRSESGSTSGLEQLTPFDIPDIRIQGPRETVVNMGTGVISKPVNASKPTEAATNNAATASEATAGHDPASPATVKNDGDTVSAPTAGDEPVNVASAANATEEVPASAAASDTPDPAPAAEIGETASAPANATSNLPVTVPGAEVLPLAAPIEPPAPTPPTADTPNLKAPAVGLPPTAPGPGVPLLGGRVHLKQNAVSVARRMRKVILRRRVLEMLLGRELAGTVHPVLSGAGGTEGVKPPVNTPAPAAAPL